jgi:CPA1 family monovalent cation:H+ antiporter
LAGPEVTVLVGVLLVVGGALAPRIHLPAHTTPYAIRMIDRRPAQRARRAGFRQRFPVAWAGFRGAVSLAAALAIPLNTADGQPLAGRDLILIATFTVIGVTMLVQATTMDAVVRWARLPADTALEEEIALAEQTATEAGLAALSRRAAELQVPDRLASQVEEAYQQRLHQLKDAVEDCGPNETPDSLLRRDAELEAELRSALLADKRNAVIKLRDQRRIQRRLDREEVRLADSALEDD